MMALFHIPILASNKGMIHDQSFTSPNPIVVATVITIYQVCLQVLYLGLQLLCIYRSIDTYLIVK